MRFAVPFFFVMGHVVLGSHCFDSWEFLAPLPLPSLAMTYFLLSVFLFVTIWVFLPFEWFILWFGVAWAKFESPRRILSSPRLKASTFLCPLCPSLMPFSDVFVSFVVKMSHCIYFRPYFCLRASEILPCSFLFPFFSINRLLPSRDWFLSDLYF